MAGAGTPGREGTPMLTVVPDVAGALPAGEPSSLIDQIVRDGARQMLAAALQLRVELSRSAPLFRDALVGHVRVTLRGHDG